MDSAVVKHFHPCRKSTKQDCFLVPWWARFPKRLWCLPYGLPRSSFKVRQKLALPLAYHSLHEGQGASCLSLHSPTSTGSLFKFRNSQVYWRRKLLGNDFLEQGDKNASLMSASYVVLLALFSSLSLGHPVIFRQLGVTNKCSWLQVSIGSFLTTPTPRGTLPSRYLMQPDDIPQTSLSGVFVSSLAKPSTFI